MSGTFIRGLEIGVSPLLWVTRKLLSIPSTWWKRMGLALAIASLTIALWARFFPAHGTLSDTWSYGGDLELFATVGCLLVLWMGGTFALDHLVVATVRRLARLLPVSGSGALAIARHTLDSHRAVSRRGYWASKQDLGGLAMIAVLIVGLLGAQTIDRAKERQVDALTFDAVVLPVGASPGSGTSVGVDHAALDPAVLTALEADSSLAVVPFGRVTVGPVGATAPTASITIVAPSDLDRITPDGARPLGFQDGFLLSPNTENGALAFPAKPPRLIDVSADAATATLFDRLWFNTNTFATRSWAESSWGDVPVVGTLVRYVGDEIPASDRLVYITRAASRAGAEAQPTHTMSADGVDYQGSSDIFSLDALAVISVYFVILASFSVIILSVRTVKTHRRVRATVAALGATPRALALAVPIDAAISLAVAFVIGLPLGGLVAALAKHPTLFASGAPLDPANTAWGLWWNLTHIAWGMVAGVTAVTWLISVTAASIYGFTVARRTPVDELREAIREGAL